MKQIVIYVTLLILTSTSVLSAQKKQLKNAVKDGKNRNGFYTADFDNPEKMDKIKKWLSKNDYVLVDFKEMSKHRYGDVVSGVGEVTFMTKRDYAQLVELNRRKQAELAAARRKQKNKEGLALLAGIVAVGAVVYQGGKYILSNSSSGSSSYSSSGSSSYSSGSKGYVIHKEKGGDIEISRGSTSSSNVNLDFDLDNICYDSDNFYIYIEDGNGRKKSINSSSKLSKHNWSFSDYYTAPVSIQISYYGGCELTCPYDHCRKQYSFSATISENGYYDINTD